MVPSHLVGIIKEPVNNPTSNPIKWILGIMISILGVFIVYKNRKLVIPALLTTSCASSSIPMVFKPIGFTQDEIQQLKADADEWNTKSNGKYFLMVDENAPDDASTINKLNKMPGNPRAIGECIAHVDNAGIRTTDSCVGAKNVESFEINVVPERDGYKFDIGRNVLHEMGHVFGKSHDSEPDTVMNANYFIQSPTLTDRDVQ